MKVEIDQGQLLKVKMMLAGVKKAAPRVISRAMNKTLTGIQSKAAKEVSGEYNITQKQVKPDFTLSKASVARLAAGFYSTGRPRSLTSFSGTRQTKKGVSVKIKKNGPRKTLKHAFIATSRHVKQKARDAGRGKQVFWRARGDSGMLVSRYPIHRLTGPRVEDHLGKPLVFERILRYGGERYKIVIDQELNYELSKL